MRRPAPSSALLAPLSLLLLLLAGCTQPPAAPAAQPTAAAPSHDAPPPQRIISLAPSVTETLFALGLGKRIVGVTEYCTYPAEALDLPRIGGYFNPSYERILELQPDLVVLLDEHQTERERIQQMGIPYVQVSHRTIAGIIDGITTIADRTGVPVAQRDALLRDLTRRMDRIATRTAGAGRPRVMVSVGRNMGSGSLKNAYAAGPRTYYHELIEAAGGSNAVTVSSGGPYPVVSAEGITVMAPDVILDMVDNLEKKGLTKASVVDQWALLPSCKAVKDKRVYVLTEDYVTVPGPRFVQLLEDMARAIHPEINWDDV